MNTPEKNFRIYSDPEVIEENSEEPSSERLPVRYFSKYGNMKDTMQIASEMLCFIERVLQLADRFRQVHSAEASSSFKTDQVYKDDEVCRFLKIDKEQLLQLIKTKKLKALDLGGGQYRILGRDIFALFDCDENNDWEVCAEDEY
jgi:hypothetical protein